MLTGPMQRKPKATRPKANVAPVSPSTPWSSYPLTKYATAIRPAIRRPFQKALKLPATRPERIVSEAPPSRDAVTISCTCFEWELVNTFVNSGMSTAASVPQLMIAASCHQSLGSAVTTGAPFASLVTDMSARSRWLMKNEVEMQRMAAIQMRRVSGCSKSKVFNPAYFAFEIASLMKYEQPDMK